MNIMFISELLILLKIVINFIQTITKLK
jgi:hypothetical protein